MFWLWGLRLLIFWPWPKPGSWPRDQAESPCPEAGQPCSRGAVWTPAMNRRAALQTAGEDCFFDSAHSRVQGGW